MLAAQSLQGEFIHIKWPVGTKPNRYLIVANMRGKREVVGEFIIPEGPFAGSIPIPVKAPAPFIVAGDDERMNEFRSIALFTESRPGEPMQYDAMTTAILGAAGTIIHAMK